MELKKNPIEKIMVTKIDADELEEIKRNYDPNSEKIFNTTWDLSEDHKDLLGEDEIDDDTIVKNLYRDLSELNIKDAFSKEDNSLNETIIHNIKQEDQDDPETAVQCPPILGG